MITSHAPCVAKNRIHLPRSRRYGSRCNITCRWKKNGTCIRGRLHVQGIIFDPLPHHSNAYPVRGIISVQRALRTAGSIAANKSTSSPNVQDPVSYKQALRSPLSGEWEAAIKSEYDSLVSRKTWTLVPCPAGRKLVDSKWVFKLKRNANGQIARYKVRLVARGFTQEKGVDYHETFAPTVRVILFEHCSRLPLIMIGRWSSLVW
jgi:hypothetical protein